MRKKAVKLSFHEGNQQHCKYIGYALGKDGKPKPKLFYLGKERSAAAEEAAKRQAQWRALRQAGKQVWDEDPTYIKERTSVAANASAEASGSVPLISVAQAVDAYLKSLKTQLEAGQFGQSYYDAQEARLKKATSQGLAQLPLSGVGEPQLSAVVLKLCARPNVCRPNGEPHRMSAVYAKASIGALRSFIDWCLDANLIPLIAPKRYQQIWKARVVLTTEERTAQLEGEANEAEHFEIEELAKLYAATANTEKPDFWRCLILLSLNCGFANEECSSLKKREVKWKEFEDESTIERYRIKTIRFGAGAYGKWRLWPETAELLAICESADEALQLTTDNGKSLTANNTIGQGWRRLLKSANVRPLSFKFLRKTGAYFCRLLSDKDTTEMYLSHADGGMIKAYAARDWDGKLADTLKAMRKEFDSMFDALPQQQDRTWKKDTKLGVSGIRGVSYCEGKAKPWRAYGMREGKRITLGYYDSPEEAGAAIQANKAQVTNEGDEV